MGMEGPHREGLMLEHCEGIKLGDSFITPEDLEENVKRWGRRVLLPGLGRKHFGESDESIFRQIAYGMPLTIIGDPQLPSLVLNAQLGRFPYAIDGDRNFQLFAARLAPEVGRIARIVFGFGLIVNYLARTPETTVLDLDGGGLHLEVYMDRQNFGDLPPLSPPTGFRESVILRRP